MTIRDDYEDTRSDFEEFCQELMPHSQEFYSVYFDYDYVKHIYKDVDVETIYQVWSKAYQCGYDCGHQDATMSVEARMRA